MSVKKYADANGLSEFWNNTKNLHVELTQAEYDALTQEEKANGTIYFITDGQPGYMIVNDSVPVGAIQAFGGSTAPNGWLICDGSAVSRTDYAELFSAIGTTYGSGDGSITFNLPDLKGRVIVGVGESNATGHTAHALGQSSGEETHTLTVDELAKHSHGGTYNTGAGTKEYAWLSTTSGSDLIFKTQSIGGDQPHNNMQPYVVTNYIIKAESYSQGSPIQGLNASDVGTEGGSNVQDELDALNDNTWYKVKEESITGGTWSLFANAQRTLGAVKWQGNATSLPSGTYEFLLPSDCACAFTSLLPAYSGNAVNSRLELVYGENKARLTTSTATTWSSVTMLYPIGTLVLA